METTDSGAIETTAPRRSESDLGAGGASATRLTRLFLESFTVMDVAEDLCSFDGDRPAAQVRALLEQRGFDLVGIRRDGLVVGYARRTDLERGRCGDYAHPFGPDDLVAGSASIADTIRSLEINGRCFVKVFERVSAIVTFSDLEKAPVRMWLFGMITILEMKMTEFLRRTLPEERWMGLLTPNRLAAMRALREERRRMGQEVELLDCLQLGDKSRIVLKERPQLRARFASMSEAKDFFNDVQRLRNNLAHAQRFIGSDWRVIVRLTASLRAIVGDDGR